MSKIQSESNSQLGMNLSNEEIVVVSMSKIQSESNSQLKDGEFELNGSCGFYVKDTI